MGNKIVKLGNEIIYLEDNIPDEEKGYAISNYDEKKLGDTITISPIKEENNLEDTQSFDNILDGDDYNE